MLRRSKRKRSPRVKARVESPKPWPKGRTEGTVLLGRSAGEPVGVYDYVELPEVNSVPAADVELERTDRAFPEDPNSVGEARPTEREVPADTFVFAEAVPNAYPSVPEEVQFPHAIRRVPSDIMVHWGAAAQHLVNSEATDELLHLFQQVEDLTARENPVIQFLGVSGGEGVSTVAALFASTVADLDVGRVLLFSDLGDEIEKKKRRVARVGAGRTADVAKREETSVDGPGLYICPPRILTDEWASPGTPVDSVALLETVRSQFRLVIIDSGPVFGGMKTLRLARNVDGVILVIEADRTGVSEAEGAAKRIRGAGGNLLGAILNQEKPLLPRLLVGH